MAAQRRFSAAYLHTPREDRILDFTIALESTLLFGIREELAFRLALAAAVLLAPEDEPNRTFKFLQLVYRLRSAIVHDGKSLEDLAGKFKHPVEQVTRQPYADVSYVLAQYTRSVLIKVLRAMTAGKSLKQVNEELLHKVITGAR